MSPTAPNDPIERFRRVVAAVRPLTQLIMALTTAAVTGHTLGFW